MFVAVLLTHHFIIKFFNYTDTSVLLHCAGGNQGKIGKYKGGEKIKSSPCKKRVKNIEREKRKIG